MARVLAFFFAFLFSFSSLAFAVPLSCPAAAGAAKLLICVVANNRLLDDRMHKAPALAMLRDELHNEIDAADDAAPDAALQERAMFTFIVLF